MDDAYQLTIPVLISIFTLGYACWQHTRTAGKDEVLSLDRRLSFAEEHLKNCLAERHTYQAVIAQLHAENGKLLDRLQTFESH